MANVHIGQIVRIGGKEFTLAEVTTYSEIRKSPWDAAYYLNVLTAPYPNGKTNYLKRDVDPTIRSGDIVERKYTIIRLEPVGNYEKAIGEWKSIYTDYSVQHYKEGIKNDE